MGCNEEEISDKPSSLSDALLFTTMCMVGLPVEVQVKDGSLYSGIFHTASLDKGYGIILKKARKIGKGKREKSFTIGSLIDTLVVLSGDFVQVVVKDFLLPAEGIIGNVASDGVEAATGVIESQPCNMDPERAPKSLINGNNSPLGILDHDREGKSFYGLHNEDTKVHEELDARMLNPLERKQEVEDRGQDSTCVEKVEELSLAPIVSVQERQVREDMPQGEANYCTHIDEVSVAKEMLHNNHCLSPSHSSDVCLPQVNSVEDTHGAMTSDKTSNGTRCVNPAARPMRPEDHPESIFPISTNFPSSDAQTSTVSTPSPSVSDVKTSSCASLSTSPNLPVPKKNSVCNTSAKEFKLNPGAKIFSPSFANSRSAPTAVPTVASTGYISSIPAVMPIAAAQSGVEISSFASRSSLPAKMVQYNSLVGGHSGVTAPYSQPIVGHTGARQQPIRISGQYHPVQAGPSYVHPTSQTVMVGRMGQLVYVHPIPQDAIQGTSVFSQGSPYPLLNPCQANMPKIPGTAAQSLQLCMTPPVVTGATQPFAVPSHIPFSHPFTAIRPIPAPGGNGFFWQ